MEEIYFNKEGREKLILGINKITDYTFVCLNDSEFLTYEDYNRLKPILENKLDSIFPIKSSFEK